MVTPGERKTVHARILDYTESIGWIVVSREKAVKRRVVFLTCGTESNGGQECPPSVSGLENPPSFVQVSRMPVSMACRWRVVGPGLQRQI